MLAFASKCADMQCLRLGTAFLPVNLIGDATTNGGRCVTRREKMQLLFDRVRFTLLSLSRRGTRRPH